MVKSEDNKSFSKKHKRDERNVQSCSYKRNLNKTNRGNLNVNRAIRGHWRNQRRGVTSQGSSFDHRSPSTFEETKNLLKRMLKIEFTQNLTLKLLDPQVRFINFLNNLKSQDIETVVDVLKVVVEASKNQLMEKNFRELLTMVLRSGFSKQRLDTFISVELNGNFSNETLLSLIKFLKLNFELIPGIAVDVFFNRVHQLKTIIDTIRIATDAIPPEIVREFEELMELVESSSIPRPASSRTKLQKEDDPPDDYRNIGIFPSSRDLIDIRRNAVFLRRNILQGAFRSVDHYLDVQFRLMREDFVQPLREGLNAYRIDEQRRQLGIRVYRGVTLIHPVPAGRQGIVFKISFDVSRLKGVRWRQSKRFIYGTLLCLSSDNFTTLIFATVANSDPVDLENGILSIKFYEETPSRLATYTMIETTNMFESYRHVLSRLQETTEETLCMKRYLVDVKNDVGLPNYLVNNEDLEYTFRDHHMWPGNKEVDWPRGVDLDMDESQYRAFKSALTNEIVVIQGPPGTGKTFVGLNICECLIKNVQQNLEDFGPILVVCYTNHALDQFLEGIVDFTDKIVRIGGRSQSEKLQKFSLLEWKKQFSSEECSTRQRNVFQSLNKIKKKIIEVQRELMKVDEKLVDLEKIRDFIGEGRFKYLERVELINWLFGESAEMEVFNSARLVDDIVESLMDEEISKSLLNVARDARKEVRSDIEGRNDVRMDKEEFDVYEHQTFEIEEDDIGDYNDDFNRAVALSLKDEDDEFSRCDDEFTQMRTRIINALIKSRLGKTERMSREEADRIDSVDSLSINDRWRLYRLWSFNYCDELHERSRPLEKEYDEYSERLNEINFEEDRQVMEGKSIIGMTTTGAARYGKVLSAVRCKIIIIEEAAEVLESHIIGSLNRGCEHLILIGDHKQLRPNPAVYALAKRYNLDLSMFERLINNGLHHSTLALQHRMRPEIAEVMKFIYEDLQNHESVLHYPDVPSVCKNMYFIDHREEEQHSEETLSYSNKYEAEFLMRFCRHLMKNGVPRSQMTILTLYSGQMNLLRRLMSEEMFEDVRICVVDNYQGEENDIILLSLVRSNSLDKIGFLDIENRICVSLSRAKHGLYVLGNFQMLGRQNDMWNRICGHLRRHGLLNSHLMLYCQNHRGKLFSITRPADFDKYPEGGCGEICGQRLRCGHACKRACHFLDKDHLGKCFEMCVRSCKNGHPCRRKCWEDCDDCDTKVEKTIPICNHRQLVACRKDPVGDDCWNRCEITLLCGHQCGKLCREKCDKCVLMVEKISPWCGHSGEYRCTDVNVQCKTPCGCMLECMHPCSGTCGSCSMGRLHVTCKENCKRSLICGHGCIDKCSLYCPPCHRPCEEQCSHNKCPNKCGDNCIPCLERCQWKCKHKKCEKLCHDICDRTVCDEICEERPFCLLCNKRFNCYGVCGEICRRKCFSCDPEIKNIFFGTEDEVGARFITLRTCWHSFEVTSMDKYMNVASENEEIVTKKCPRCSSIISKKSCFRYCNIIKRMSSDIGEVSKRMRDVLEKISYGKYSQKLETRYWQISTIFAMEGVGNFFDKTKKLNDIVLTLHDTSLDLVYEVYKLCHSRVKGAGTEYTDWCIKKLLLWLEPSKRKFNQFEMNQFNAELGRIEMLIQIDNNRGVMEAHLDTISAFVEELKNITFLRDVAEDFRRRWSEFLKNAYLPNMSITENERRQIVAAINLGKGRWFKCPNGHFYTIGECGGATQISKCPECDCSIGGENHRLLGDNLFAPEMDYADQPAYPGMQNV